MAAKQDLTSTERDRCADVRRQWATEEEEFIAHPPKDHSIKKEDADAHGCLDCSGCHRYYPRKCLDSEGQATGCSTCIMHCWLPEKSTERDILLFGSFGSVFADMEVFFVKDLQRYLQRFGLPVEPRDKDRELGIRVCDLCLHEMLKDHIITYLGHEIEWLCGWGSAEWAYYMYFDHPKEAGELLSKISGF